MNPLISSFNSRWSTSRMRHRSLSAIEFAKSNICFLYKTRVPSSPRPSNELAQSLGGRNSTCGAVLRSNAILFPVPRNFACNSLANGVNCPHFDGTLLILPSESWLYSSSLSRWSLTHGVGLFHNEQTAPLEVGEKILGLERSKIFRKMRSKVHCQSVSSL